MAPTERYDELRTARLLMRRWLDSDREPFAALNADQETMRYFPATLDRAASDALIDRIERRFDEQGYGLWALERLDTHEFIGFTGLNPLPDHLPIDNGLEVGWRLARSAWHQGYATEAAHAALNVAFDGLDQEHVQAITAVINQPSIAVMRRLGMREHARFDHPDIDRDSPIRPHVRYRTAATGRGQAFDGQPTHSAGS